MIKQRSSNSPATIIIPNGDSSFQGLGGWLDDQLAKVTTSVESQARNLGQEYLPKEVYEKAHNYATSGQAVEALKSIATDQASKYASAYAQKDEVQDKGIQTAVGAAADKVSAELINAKNSWKAGTFFQDYKTPIYVTSGIMGVLFLKWLIGTKRVEKVYTTK